MTYMIKATVTDKVVDLRLARGGEEEELREGKRDARTGEAAKVLVFPCTGSLAMFRPKSLPALAQAHGQDSQTSNRDRTLLPVQANFIRRGASDPKAA
jgi:hypothetical protein